MTVKELKTQLESIQDDYEISIGYGSNIPRYTIESIANDNNLHLVWFFVEELKK